MSKPWDLLRPLAKPPIAVGVWVTSNLHAGVTLISVRDDNVVMRINGGSAGQMFEAADLRQLAEFCNEMADQLEG